MIKQIVQFLSKIYHIIFLIYNTSTTDETTYNDDTTIIKTIIDDMTNGQIYNDNTTTNKIDDNISTDSTYIEDLIYNNTNRNAYL